MYLSNIKSRTNVHAQFLFSAMFFCTVLFVKSFVNRGDLVRYVAAVRRRGWPGPMAASLAGWQCDTALARGTLDGHWCPRARWRSSMTSPVRSLRMRTRNRRLINPTVGLGDILEERRTNERRAKRNSTKGFWRVRQRADEMFGNPTP